MVEYQQKICVECGRKFKSRGLACSDKCRDKRKIKLMFEWQKRNREHRKNYMKEYRAL